MAPYKGPRPEKLAFFRGTLVHTPTYGELETLADRLLVVQDGKIARIVEGSEEEQVLQEMGGQRSSVRRLGVGEPERR